jgi:hypothetical protein
MSCFKKINKIELIKFFKSWDILNNKLINRTKKRLIDVISTTIVKICESELDIIYEDYLTKNNFTKYDSNMFLRSLDYTRERNSNNMLILDYLYQKLLDKACMILKEETVSEYASLYFLRELLRGKSHLYETIEITVLINLYRSTG